MKRVLPLLLLIASAYAQRGPQRTAVLESPAMKVTVSTQKQKGDFEPAAMNGLIAIYIRVENLSDQSLEVDISKAYLKLETGQALNRIPAEDAVGVLQRMPVTRMLVRQANMDNPALIASGFKAKEFPQGAIPPKSWKEGLLYFQPQGKVDKKQSMTFFLPGLLDGAALLW